MTYRRDTGSWAEATTALLKAGQDWLGEQLGVSPSRLRQCANPHRVVYDRDGRGRADSLPVHLACQADITAARLGLGTPLFDCYRRRLVEAGALRHAPFERRSSRLESAVRAAATLLLSVLNDPSANSQHEAVA